MIKIFIFQPFVDICVQYNNNFEAQKYMPKVKDEMKVKYFVKLGYVFIFIYMYIFYCLLIFSFYIFFVVY